MMKTLHLIEAIVLVSFALIDLLLGLSAPRAAPESVEVVDHLAPVPASHGGVQPPLLQSMTCIELRRLAQARGLRRVGGLKASKARKADLIAALA